MKHVCVKRNVPSKSSINGHFLSACFQWSSEVVFAEGWGHCIVSYPLWRTWGNPCQQQRTCYFSVAQHYIRRHPVLSNDLFCLDGNIWHSWFISFRDSWQKCVAHLAHTHKARAVSYSHIHRQTRAPGESPQWTLNKERSIDLPAGVEGKETH